MSRLDQLLNSYRRHVALPLKSGLPMSQRVWFVVYPPEEERRLQTRLPEFEIATKDQGLRWEEINLIGTYSQWVGSLDPDERETCLATTEILESYKEGFLTVIRQKIEGAFEKVPADIESPSVFALTGLMELFDFVFVSEVIGSLKGDYKGILLVFFPGERAGNTYRFLNARDGWDYLAIPILSENAH